jgi:hypothetical protein
MTDHADALFDDAVQHEIREQAAEEPVDEDTAREAFELELMEHDASEEGEEIGDEMP